MARQRKPKKGDVIKIEFGYGTEGGRYPSQGATTVVVTRCFREDGMTLVEGVAIEVTGDARDETSRGDVVQMDIGSPVEWEFVA